MNGALFHKEQLAAINKKQDKLLADEKKRAEETEIKLKNEIALLRESVTASKIPKKIVDYTAGKYAMTAAPKGTSAPPLVHMVADLEAEKERKKLEEEKTGMPRGWEMPKRRVKL